MRYFQTATRSAFGLCVIFLMVFFHAASIEAKVGSSPGDQAQDFTLKDADGVSHTLRAYRGNVVVLYFAMWCSTCRSNTLELQREIFLPLKDKGVSIFAVDYLGNKQEEIQSIVQDLGLAYPVLLDDRALTDRYGEKMSITLVIDRQGVIRYRDFYDLEKVKGAVAEAAGVSLIVSPAVSSKKKKEPRLACTASQDNEFIEKQVFYGSSSEEYFGFAVSPGPVDLNKDGLPDTAIGTPSAEGGKGAVYIRYGRKDGFPDNPDVILTGDNAGDCFGANLLVTDTNNDGFPDLVVGGTMSRKSRGSVSVFLNSQHGLSPRPGRIIEGGAAGDWFGSCFAAGDINRDGFTDLAIAALNEAGRGAIHLYYGKPEGIFGKSATVIGGSMAHDAFGSAICVADMNGDGFDDLIVGAAGANAKGVDRGTVSFYFGGRQGTSRDAEIIIEGESDMDGFGGALSCQADLDRDGHRDLLVGAPGSGKAGKWAGAVSVFFGPLESGSDTGNIRSAVDADLHLTHGETGSMYGSCLAGLGDLNGDGIDDFAVGAMNSQQQPERAGAIYIYYGSRDRKMADYEVIPGSREDGRFGRGISSLGRKGFLVTETGNSEKADKNGAVRFFTSRAAIRRETECSVCGMMLSKYRHTRFEVMEKDGTKHATCGVQCGLVLQLRLKDRFISAEATDFISGRSADAAAMFYVYKSEAVPDMWPSFIAFRIEGDADKFRKGFGGEVLDYQQALTKAELIR